jgi:hypothetical protein
MLGTWLRDAAKMFSAANPIIKWGVIAVVALFAILFLGRQSVDLWVNVVTAQSTVDRIKADSAAEQARSKAAKHVPCILEGTPACDELDKRIKEHQDRR